MKADIKDIRETAEMVLVDMEIMRNLKMGNLVRVGKVGSYLILQIINSSLSLPPSSFLSEFDMLLSFPIYLFSKASLIIFAISVNIVFSLISHIFVIW